jgi:acyl-[acyl-carrier-protein]-phospholipid O-acyltransferase / long-chain-fatty-acid--[acyl-carrier-protein] ligase
MQATETEQIRKARGKFAAMAGSYFMGNFNDNFYKQAVMLWAVATGLGRYQGLVGAAFTLPFLLFAAPAGWLADRYPKRAVVVGAKTMELLASFVGAAGLITGNLWLMIGMVALMGLQSTFFSPALNGSIPELYPEHYVTKANAVLRMIVTVGILLGISLSGVVLGLKGQPILHANFGQAMVGLCAIAFAAVGLFVSLGVPRLRAADPGRPFPVTGPLDTFSELRRIWADRQLGRILVADVYIWAAGVSQLMIINTLGLQQFGFSEMGTSLLVACQLLGIAGGGLLAASFAKGERWFRVLLPAGFGLAATMGAIGAIPVLPAHFQIPALYILVALAGVAGGLFMIPCESFMQIRPAPERKGAVWASANFASFGGMSVASLAYTFIPALNTLRPTFAYLALGAISLLFTLWLASEFKRKEWA